MLLLSQMECFSLEGARFPGSVKVSHFPSQSGVDEYHIMVCPTDYGSFDVQIDWLGCAYQNALEALGLDPGTAVFRRFFCSDLPNHATALEARPFANPRNASAPCAVSWTCQPPGGPAKVAMWAYHVSDPAQALAKTQEGTSVTLRRGDLSHHWTTGLTCPDEKTAGAQTNRILEQYTSGLSDRDMTLANNTVRTWFFVRDVDVNYGDFVVARRTFFADHGLTPDTHFIASTGVEGFYTDVAATITMDAYAVAGLRPKQVEYLAAPEHLSPTQLYGVTFERGTAVAYRDRKHVLLSGTASIDHEGRILYPGNVSRQLDRTLENIEALLEKAGATLRDMSMFIVYVRDPADHAFTWRRLAERFGDLPMQVVVAPVCRPGWLIEIEGLAIVPASNPEFPPF